MADVYQCSRPRPQDYAILAARIAISNLHKETKKTFSHVITDLYNYSACTARRADRQREWRLTRKSLHTVNPKNGRPSSMISKETYDVIVANADELNSAVIYDRDFSYVRLQVLRAWPLCGTWSRHR